MNILDLLSGKKSYIDIVKEFIFKLFIHEAHSNNCGPKDLKIVINCDERNNLSIMTFLNSRNEIVRVIPDNEVQEILMK